MSAFQFTVHHHSTLQQVDVSLAFSLKSDEIAKLQALQAHDPREANHKIEQLLNGITKKLVPPRKSTIA